MSYIITALLLPYDKVFGPYSILKKLKKFKAHQSKVYRSVNDTNHIDHPRSIRTAQAIKGVREINWKKSQLLCLKVCVGAFKAGRILSMTSF